MASDDYIGPIDNNIKTSSKGDHEFLAKQGTALEMEKIYILVRGSVILESNKEISKPMEGYTRLQEWLGKGLLTSNGERWRAKRKMLTPAFHFSILKDFVPIFNKEAAILLEQFRLLSDKGCTADVFPLIKLCTLD
ncbi:hypothetical protein COOONC_18694, partial [Cooperia oncophora]